MSSRSRGTYLLLLGLRQPLEIAVRSGRVFSLDPGLYTYVGSALGPGGLTARLGRHVSESRRKHWHIDFLVPHADQIGAVVRPGKKPRECDWAGWAERSGGVCIAGFGASDCRCRGHLFRFDVSRDTDCLLDVAAAELGAHRISREDLLPGRTTVGRG